MPSIDDPAALLERLATQRWETAARHAWRQYQQRGRGAIVFSFRTPDPNRTEPLRYLTFTGPPDEIAQSSMAPLNRLVNTYDPRHEVVIAAVLPDDRTVFDVFANDPPPARIDADSDT